MTELREIHLELCKVSVFSAVLDKPMLASFMKMMRAPTLEERIQAYSAMAFCVYEGGASLTDCTLRAVCEDENVYIKALAHKLPISDSVVRTARRELKSFQRFASLTTKDFEEELGTHGLAELDSYEADFSARFDERVENIEKHGYGIFAGSCMFRLSDNKELEAVRSADRISMKKFVGYSDERERVVNNTIAFIEGRPAANALLCGDAGTGKSSTVKAVANEFFPQGVRLIELRKDQLSYLPYVMGRIADNPLKFIIFIDDLSFNQNDDNFSMLKAALEGSASAKSDNCIIYATSNRRHIIKESFGDREGGDVHINDTLQETLSLSERFGLVVLFSKPNKALYLEIVHTLADRNNITMDREELDIKAEAFALRRGNRSARCAEQFIESLM